MDRNYFGITDIGKLRTNNEDTFIAEKITGTDFVIACVIDGVGGYTGGEVAAEIARKTLLRLLDQPAGDLSLLMQAAIAETNDQIIAAKQVNKEYEDMACVLTLALADLKNNQFYYAHVGDTRLYLLRDNSLIKISKDQSFVGFMEDSGRLTEEQAMQHPKRNEINKALGFAGNIGTQDDYIETGHSPFLPGDLILLCSDGLSDMVNKQVITDVLVQSVSLEQKGIELIKAANDNGGKDNITVVLVKNDKASSVHEATKPIALPKKNKSLPIANTPTAKDIPVVKDTSIVKDAPAKQEQKQTPTAVVVKTKETGQKEVRQKESSGISPVLIFIIFAIAALAAYFFWKKSQSDLPGGNHQITDSAVYSKNAKEILLQDQLDKLTGNILILHDSVFKSPVLISEPIRINRDSLYLKADSTIVFKCDTGYKGQPFIIAPSNRSVLLENITFENFEDVSSLQKKGVLLKNVQFIKTNGTKP